MKINILPTGILIKSVCVMGLDISIYFLHSLSDSNDKMNWEETIVVPSYV